MNITEIKKPALCVRREDLPSVPLGTADTLPVPINMFLLPTHLRDRVGPYSCEEDAQSQQLLPYVVLTNPHGEIFCYSRGAAGAEAKLKTKLSIGLGGHVDSAPPEGHTLHSWLVSEARRELEEEVGFTEPVPVVFDALILDHVKEREETGALYVGQCHVGLLTIIECESADVKKLEEGVINNGKWMSRDQLHEVYYSLEPWSQLALTYITRKTQTEA